MFQRFMIVCWALFALIATVGVIGWVGVVHFENHIDQAKAESEAAATSEKSQSWTIHEPGQDPETDLGRDATPKEVAQINGDLREQRLEKLNEELRPVRKKKEDFKLVMIVGALCAVAALLWNIILHTGHWIWMGRKAR